MRHRRTRKRASDTAPALVVGAGVSGLTCALRLLESGRPVEIRARELPPRTTSDVAAAFWYPYRALPRERVSRWARASYRRFGELAADPATGVRLLPAVELFRRPAPDPWWAVAVPGWRRVTGPELRPGYVDGYHFAAPIIDTRRYMPWLVARVLELGGVIHEAEVRDLEAVAAGHPLTVNCTGLGARELTGDSELVAVRGELVRVDDPGLDSVCIDHESPAGISYVIPRGDDCVLGGSAEEGREELEPDPAVAAEILERCRQLEPRLQGMPGRGGAVGLRPGRTSVRVEAQRLPSGGRIVHNYGHGGAGITLSWGCAGEVLELAAAC